MSSEKDLTIDFASHDAALYACNNWHYSKTIPKSKTFKVGAWEYGEYIGVIIYSWGATPQLVKPYGLEMIQGCELTRVALNKHKTPVSRIMAISMKFLRKHNPGLRLIVSFADPSEGHHGGIYQATGWIYTGKSAGCFYYIDKTGRQWHPRNVSENLTLSGKCMRPSQCTKVFKEGKHRYLFPLDNEMRHRILHLSQPYPKRAGSIASNVSPLQGEEGGLTPTPALHLQS